MSSEPAKTLLVISQVYVPDTPSVGQHMHDVAAEMATRGWRVITYTSAGSYENPSRILAKHEHRDGVDIRRLPLSSFGKRSLAIRALGGLGFVVQVAVRGLFIHNLTGILVSTSPPFASFASIIIKLFRRIPITYWVMDINPDQAIELGKAEPSSWSVRMLEWLNRRVLNEARTVVTLDHFMGDRLERKVPLADKLIILPPWPHQSHLEPVEHINNPFRLREGLTDKFVIMYSGNVTFSHPVDTILKAAKRLKYSDANLVFLFIGGGEGMNHVQDFVLAEGLTNVRTLPYQPLEDLRFSLSAADVHLVAMGDDMVGVLHPCKIYGAMAVARPVLLVGPKNSHVGEILDEFQIGWHVSQGDVDSAVECVRKIGGVDAQELLAKGLRGVLAVEDRFSMSRLCGSFCDIVEATGASEQTPDILSIPKPGPGWLS